MDLEALLILLQPWLRPFLAFAFFYVCTLFLPGCIIARTAPLQ